VAYKLHVMRYTSHVTRHTSHVTRHTSRSLTDTGLLLISSLVKLGMLGVYGCNVRGLRL